MRVLHVTEAMGAGVTSSILAMAESTPDIDHHLLACLRSSHDTGADLNGGFSSVRLLRRNPLSGVAVLRRMVHSLYPDVVHAHSSIAGLFVRLAALEQPRIVYSPHGFVVQRRDLRRTERLFYERVERRLAPRTDLLAAVSPYEAELAAGLGYSNVAVTPNRAAVEPNTGVAHRLPLRVATVGRVSPAKDWRFLLHLKRYAENELGLLAEWEWLGGGDPDGEQALAAAGVDVSGWISRDELMGRLARAQVYVHTAAWDASPVSILEAAALGLPLVVRAIPPLDGLELPGYCGSVASMAARIGELSDTAAWIRAQEESCALTLSHSASIQGKLLRQAYERACDGAPAPHERLAVSGQAHQGVRLVEDAAVRSTGPGRASALEGVTAAVGGRR